MKNKAVGFLMIGVAGVIGIIVYLFNSALTKIVNASCSHGTTCPMYSTIKTQTYIGLVLIGVIALIGVVLIFNKQETKIIVKKEKEKSEKIESDDREENIKLLDFEEKTIYQIVIDSKGAIFQSEIVEKSGFDKVKVTRILDKLEGRRLIERRRRGMTNVVIAK